MISECPHAGLRGCPYFERNAPSVLRGQPNGCHADTDHAVPQRLARRKNATELEKAYIYSEVNQRQLCRWLHDIKNEDYDSGYTIPPVRDMIIALTVSLEMPEFSEIDSVDIP